MNERIRLLAEQAGYTPLLGFDFANSLQEVFLEKFAELIVGECITNIARDTTNWPGDEGTMAYYQGVQDAVKSIRKHFRVEE